MYKNTFALVRRVLPVVFLVIAFGSSNAFAETRWALIISGASGGEKYAEQMAGWRGDLQKALIERYQFKPEFVKVLVDETATAGDKGSAANVRTLMAEVKKSTTKDDFVFIVLLGHGTFDGDVAKFNLVGPDLSAKDWTDLIAGIQGRVALVNTTEASFPFLASLTAKGRVVITATDSPAQKYATVFPEYFVKAIKEASTDLDKNGRTSIYEVFVAASAAVKQHYEQRGQLTTERALLDDNGDGKGREAAAEGPDGGIARLAYLDSEVVAEILEPRARRLDPPPPRARAAGRRTQAAQRRDARRGMEFAVRKDDAGAGPGVGGNPQEILG